MRILREIDPCRRAVRDWQRSGERCGLVPTMGALHDGHFALIREARRRCPRVAVSIFVNPTQFTSREDYEKYPHQHEQDFAACDREGVDLVFAPTAETMHAVGGSTMVHVSGVTEGLCGPARPGHFDGVATVVTKLFHILPADMAFFGEKDFQQLAMIRIMTRELDLPVEIVACPTVREPDGLAFSSRNGHLTSSERTQAASLSRGLFAAAKKVQAGVSDSAKLCRIVRETILAAGPADIEYAEVVDDETLKAVTTIRKPARICLAVRFGICRLIDNVAVAVDFSIRST